MVMTQEERKANYRKLFDGIKIGGLTVNDDLEEDCIDMFGKVYYHHEQYMRLYLDFSNDKGKGREFIDNLTERKLQDCGLNPYDGKLDKGYMLSLLNSTGRFDIKLELPDNYEK